MTPLQAQTASVNSNRTCLRGEASNAELESLDDGHAQIVAERRESSATLGSDGADDRSGRRSHRTGGVDQNEGYLRYRCEVRIWEGPDG